MPVADGDEAEERAPGEVNMPPHSFSFVVAVCFTLNYIIGSGFLTLPWAFYETGWLLGLLLLGIVSVVSILASSFILEAMARAEVLTNFESRDDDKLSLQSTGRGAGGAYHTISSASAHSLMSAESGGGGGGSSASLQAGADVLALTDTSSQVGARKFEIPELCELFLGVRGRQVYTVVIGIYMYGTLWAYCTVWANAWATLLPLTAAGNAGSNSTSYVSYLALFAVLVVPASLMELSEQIGVQVTLSACRIVMLAVMVLTIVVAHVSGSEGAFGPELGESHQSAPAWQPSNIYILLPIAAYANIFHHSIPSLAHPVRNKSSLGRVFSTALLISWAAYAGIGLVISVYFGEHTKVASNLNWRYYNGGGVGVGDGEEVPLFARLVSFFVVLFPAMDVASAYPLNAITLGNNLMSAVYGSALVPAMEKSRLHRTAFRLLAAVPPMLLALVESNLGEITDFTGLTGFAVAFVFPALLSMYSEQRLAALGLETKTRYSSRWTRRSAAVLTAAGGVFLVLFVAISLLTIGPPHGPTRRRQ